MKFRREPQVVEEEPPPPPPVDPTAWLIQGGFPEFILMHTNEIKYMAMFGYTYLHGSKLFPTFPRDASMAYKLACMVFQCTGGGILVPIFINSIPVPLAQDAYPVAILVSFLLHQYVPILSEVMKLSPILKTAMIVLYETNRAYVVTKLTRAAGSKIAPSDFSIALFGPILCGAIGGCGGAFLPLDKGLDPIKSKGLGQPMLSALIGAAFYHLFCSTSISDGVMEKYQKAQVVVASFFICWHLYLAFEAAMASSGNPPPKKPAPAIKEEPQDETKKEEEPKKEK